MAAEELDGERLPAARPNGGSVGAGWSVRGASCSALRSYTASKIDADMVLIYGRRSRLLNEECRSGSGPWAGQGDGGDLTSLTSETAVRTQAVAAKASVWADLLIDLSYRNNLLRYRETKTVTLRLSQAEPEAVRRVLDGESDKVRLRQLFPDPTMHAEACTRARGLRRKIVLFEEEQGLEVGYLAYGLLVVQSRTARTQDLRAPLLLRPLTLRASSPTEADYILEAREQFELNPVLLYALEREHGLADVVGAEQKLASIGVGAPDVETHLTQLAAALSEFLDEAGIEATVETMVAAGAFSFQKLKMVEDLRQSTDVLAHHDVIAAIAGHAPSAAALHDQIGDPFSGSDAIKPAAEFLVLDADSTQHAAIHTVLSGSHVVIDGPPGTGKSQTIANVIAELSARGKKVLFVAEKQAAIEAVTNRLSSVGLEHLVLDLHDSRTGGRQVSRQIAQALAQARQEPAPDVDDLHHRLASHRASAREYVTELHRIREPWQIAMFDAFTELSALGDAVLVRLGVDCLHQLEPHTRSMIEEQLRRFVDLGGWRWYRGESVWSGVQDADEAAVRSILVELDNLAGRSLQQAQTDITSLLTTAGLQQPDTYAGWQEVLDLLEGVARSVDRFGGDVYGPELDELYWATGPRAWRRTHHRDTSLLRRLRLVRRARRMHRDRRRDKKQLHNELRSAVAERDDWRTRATDGGLPVPVEGLSEVVANFRLLRTRLAAVGAFARLGGLDQDGAEAVQAAVDKMEGQRDDIFRLPELTRLRAHLEKLGLGRLLTELAVADATGDESVRAFKRSWYSTFRDHLRLQVPALARFAGAEHGRLVQEFRHNDARHLAANAKRVRHSVARHLRDVRESYPEQDSIIRKQATLKRGHLKPRMLVHKARDVLLALRPCWAMSPLVVSQVLPAEPIFDVVIFDEASQVRPEERSHLDHARTSACRRWRRQAVAADRHVPAAV